MILSLIRSKPKIWQNERKALRILRLPGDGGNIAFGRTAKKLFFHWLD
jgi:hypothetical protein